MDWSKISLGWTKISGGFSTFPYGYGMKLKNRAIVNHISAFIISNNRTFKRLTPVMKYEAFLDLFALPRHH